MGKWPNPSYDFPESRFEISRLKVGPICLRNTQFGVFPFGKRFMAHCIHCLYGHSGVDRKNMLLFFNFCTLCLCG